MWLLLGIALGGLLVAAIVCAFFLIQGAWQDSIFYGWTYNFKFYMKAMTPYEKVRNVYRSLKLSMYSMGMGLLAGTGGLLALCRATGWLGERSAITWRRLHVAIWGFSSLLSALVGMRPFGHYFILSLPPWCLLAGLTFDSVAAALWDAAPKIRPRAKRRRILLISLIALALVGRSFLAPVRHCILYFDLIDSWVRDESNNPLYAYLAPSARERENLGLGL